MCPYKMVCQLLALLTAFAVMVTTVRALFPRLSEHEAADEPKPARQIPKSLRELPQADS